MGLILAIIWLHFFADFILQTDDMALKKSSDNNWLALHICAYSLPFFAIGISFLGLSVEYVCFNALAHFVTDWCTSRVTSRLWKAGRRHMFFVVIGLDQAIHMTCLIVGLAML